MENWRAVVAIREIRASVATGETQSSAAERYKVHPSAISRVVRYERWRAST